GSEVFVGASNEHPVRLMVTGTALEYLFAASSVFKLTCPRFTLIFWLSGTMLHGASITEPLKVIVPPPASVVAIDAAKAEVQHIMPAVAMASIILLRIENMSFERMRIIAHKLKTGLRVLMRSVQEKGINNKCMESTEMTAPVPECLYFQLMAGQL
ncbi:TPA: hypothetical protein ACWV7Q_003250, partial [Salmonella enterica subsp. enterica serovar Muenchen]|nr:hypothetical protein [Salmonella enterica]